MAPMLGEVGMDGACAGAATSPVVPMGLIDRQPLRQGVHYGTIMYGCVDSGTTKIGGNISMNMLRLFVLVVALFGLISGNAKAGDDDSLTREASAGDSWAQYALGVTYLNGNGRPKDVGQALAWFEKSADQANWAADAQMGSIYMQGLNGAKNYAEARRRFLRAIEERPSQPSSNPNVWEGITNAFLNRGTPEAFLGVIYEEG